MLELLLVPLTEKIAELARERKARRQGIFNEFYREIFDNLSQVHTDYLINLQDRKDALQAGKNAEELKRTIGAKRAALKSVRDHIEATIRSVSDSLSEARFDQLEVNLLSEIDTYMRSYFNGRTNFTGVGLLIDEIGAFLEQDNPDFAEKYSRRYQEKTLKEHMLDELDRTERWLEKQFSDICVIYNALRVSVFKGG